MRRKHREGWGKVAACFHQRKERSGLEKRSGKRRSSWLAVFVIKKKKSSLCTTGVMDPNILRQCHLYLYVACSLKGPPLQKIHRFLRSAAYADLLYLTQLGKTCCYWAEALGNQRAGDGVQNFFAYLGRNTVLPLVTCIVCSLSKACFYSPQLLRSLF